MMTRARVGCAVLVVVGLAVDGCVPLRGMRQVPAERAGVKPETIRDLHKGRVPKAAPKDERTIYDFVQELYKTRRVSDKTFARVRALLGDAATVELVGILGYYVLISMILNVFRMSPPPDEALPFAET